MRGFAALHTFAFLLQAFPNNHQSPASSSTQNHPAKLTMPKACENANGPISNCATISSLCADEQGATTVSTPHLVSSVLPPLPEGSRRIYLLRHGETDWNRLGKIQGGGFDIPLNENGRQQALTTAIALEDIPLEVVVSSHLSRAKETADILWARHNSTVKDRRLILNGFAEMSFGEFEGLASRGPEVDPAVTERFITISKQLKQDGDLAYPGGGESTKDVAARSTEALHQVLDDFPDRRHIAIVAHGRTNKVTIAATALGDVMRYPNVKQGNTCINVLDIDANGKWTVQILNYIEHVKDNVIIRL